jgi:uncharacterized PurR-regulated membrane protein YhhQ (DUF165 family)
MWLLIFKPDGGPQGGELAAVLLILFMVGWTLVSLVHAMLYAGTLVGGWTRYLKAFGIWIVLWPFVCWGLYKLSDLAASVYAAAGARRAGLIGFILLALLLYVVSIAALRRVSESFSRGAATIDR